MTIIPQRILALCLVQHRDSLIFNYIISFFLVFAFCNVTHYLSGFNTCFFKYLFHLPCPGCGITTGLTHFFNLNFSNAFQSNPASIIIGLLLFTNMVIALSAIPLPNKISNDFLVKLSRYSDTVVTVSLTSSYLFLIIKNSLLWH